MNLIIINVLFEVINSTYVGKDSRYDPKLTGVCTQASTYTKKNILHLAERRMETSA